jgi:hypothetical protein
VFKAGPTGDISFLRQRFKDDEFHSFAVENINAAGALLFGRVTYPGMKNRPASSRSCPRSTSSSATSTM